MRIRPATTSDRPAIWSILEPTIRAGETYALDRDLPMEAALAYWMGEPGELFVAELDGVVVGTYGIRPNRPGGGSHVANASYMTAPAATGRGIARAMARHSLDHARGRGFRAMQFNFVVASNVRAVALWTSLGFAVVGRLPGAFDHPTEGFVDALVMFMVL